METHLQNPLIRHWLSPAVHIQLIDYYPITPLRSSGTSLFSQNKLCTSQRQLSTASGGTLNISKHLQRGQANTKVKVYNPGLATPSKQPSLIVKKIIE